VSHQGPVTELHPGREKSLSSLSSDYPRGKGQLIHDLYKMHGRDDALLFARQSDTGEAWASMKFLLVALILVLVHRCMRTANANSSDTLASKPHVRVPRMLRIPPTTPSSNEDSSLTTDPIIALMQLHAQGRQSFGPRKYKPEPITTDSQNHENGRKKPVKNKADKKADKKSEKGNGIASCKDENFFIGKSVLQWTNPSYPDGDFDKMTCLLRFKRDPNCWKEIVQIKVILVDLNLAQPDEGACKHDNITLHGSDLQGQDVGRGLQLCGREPRDYVWSSGKKYPQHKHRKSQPFALQNLSIPLVKLIVSLLSSP
jgi:hypothetical protein